MADIYRMHTRTQRYLHTLEYLAFPTMLVFLDGREFLREGRAVSLHQLEDKLSRVYNILVD